MTSFIYNLIGVIICSGAVILFLGIVYKNYKIESDTIEE